MKLKIITPVFMIVFLMGIVQACSCIPPEGVEAEFEKSYAVFQGKVFDVREEFIGMGKTITFHVEKNWKMANEGSIEVKTYSSSASCGYDFVEGESYVVYANIEEGDIIASLCSRTSLVENAQGDIQILDGLEWEELVAEEKSFLGKILGWFKNLFN